MDIKKLKPLTTSPIWPLFEEYIEEQIEAHVERLVRTTSTEEVHKLRGMIVANKALLALKDNIKQCEVY